MDIYAVLKELNIPYTEVTHEAVYTIEEANEKVPEIAGVGCKNLFLTDHKGKYFLVFMEENNRVDPCPFCSSQLVSETNSLFYRYPYIADEWDEEINIEHSEMITYGTTSQFAWNCRFHEDHHYIQSANRRTDLNMCIIHHL